jgi:CDGSH-type Zn-finger protein
VQGGIPVTGSDGQPYQTRNRVTLCRCGKSGNKPFCDGTHIETGFDDGAISGSEAMWW